jgi:riboflavin synthase
MTQSITAANSPAAAAEGRKASQQETALARVAKTGNDCRQAMSGTAPTSAYQYRMGTPLCPETAVAVKMVPCGTDCLLSQSPCMTVGGEPFPTAHTAKRTVRSLHLTATAAAATLGRMFTGLIQTVGRVAGVSDLPNGRRLVVDPGTWPHRPAHGESIAVNGCCLTIANDPGDQEANGMLHFDVIQRTLDVTTLGGLRQGDRANLEHAATPTTMLGGHIVQGHIDGIGVVARVQKSDAEYRIRFDVPDDLRDCIIETGSIAVSGVSLTVAELTETGFGVALIPTTLSETNLGDLAEGDRVNLETDYVAKAVIHWLRRQDRRAR